jgi:nucleoside-diphosphate-sugar epimerase
MKRGVGCFIRRTNHMSTTRHLIIGMEETFALAILTALRNTYGPESVWTTDEAPEVTALVKRHGITDLYLLSAMFPPTGVEHPAMTWHRSTRQLLTVLDIARKTGVKVFWPSSLCVFGPSAPSEACPDGAAQEATNFFSIAKRAGEQWCEHYRHDHKVDVRCLRLPVLIRPTPPGEKREPTLAPTLPQARPVLPLDEAIRATMELMAAPAGAIRATGIYNLAGVSISVLELVTEIGFHHPETGLGIWNLPDHPGPVSLDDSAARNDWGWRPRYDLFQLVKSLLQYS